MYAHAIIIAAAQVSASFANAYSGITPQVAAKRVAECGVDTVTVKSDAELDTDVLVVGVLDSVSNQTLTCIDKAASFYDVELPSPAQSRFNAIREARSAVLVASKARKWLKAHDLLDELPKYEAGVTDDVLFGREVEKLCGADRALQSGYGPHTLNPEWVMQDITDGPSEDGPMACLLNVTWATGFKINFIGNEIAAP
ncbi:MAG TPA: hypothetical protein VMQ93_13135 [Novosphingobium sp.]|nr:hypothetical protein [Novosphingobium sp.]